MILDLKRDLLRHLIATLAYRARIAVSDAPENFTAFKIGEAIRTPGEILAHIGDLLQGSLSLLKGEFVYLNSSPLPWNEEIARFFTAAKEFDSYLASDAPLNQPIEKIIQGPISDALTHIGQIVMLRRAAGAPIRVESYFTAEIVLGEIEKEISRAKNDDKLFLIKTNDCTTKKSLFISISGLFKSILNGIEDLTGVRLNLGDIFAARFNLITVLLINAYIKKGKLDKSHAIGLSSLFSTILELKLKAAEGDKSANTLYKGIEKLAYPPKMIRNKKNKKTPFLPIVEDMLNNYHSSPHLVRAYEIRRLMSELSFIIEPICDCTKPKNFKDLLVNTSKNQIIEDENQKNFIKNLIENFEEQICKCYKLNTTSKIKLREKPQSKNENLTEEANIFFQGATQAKKSNFTWEGLAKKIYLERESAKDSSAKLTERDINRSLQYLRQYESDYPEVIENCLKLPVLDGENLPYQILTPI